jgi:hypothetical protein
MCNNEWPIGLRSFAGEPGERRKSGRAFADLPVNIVIPRRGLFTANLDNISEYGCFLSGVSTHILNPDESFSLKIRGQPAVHCRVAWSEMSEVGAQFAEPISSALVEDLTRRSLWARLGHAEMKLAPLEPLPPLKTLGGDR